MQTVAVFLSTAVLAMTFSATGNETTPPPDPAETAVEKAPAPARVRARAHAHALRFLADYLDGNETAALAAVTPDAERRNDGPGSAAEILKDGVRGIAEVDLRINEVVLFEAADIEKMKERFPDDMWDADRIPARMENAYGCLFTFRWTEDEESDTGIAVGLVRRVGDDVKLFYIDDD